MITRHHTSKRMSQIVEYSASDSIVVLSGQVSQDKSLDVAGQTFNILSNVEKYLYDAGTDKTKIVSAYIWLPDISDFEAMNSVWDAWVPAGNGPARACVEARLADPSLKVEIQVIAVK